MKALLAAALVVLALPALAADLPKVDSRDPRIVTQTLNALQAMLDLREAEKKAIMEDAQKREQDWATYSAPLWQPSQSE